MKILNFLNKTILPILFVIIFLSTSQAKPLDKFNRADRVSDYFSGILLLNDNQYEKSFDFLKKLSGLEISHINYSKKYLYSLVNSGNLKEAFNYSKKLEKRKSGNFESDLIIGVYYLKNKNHDLAQKYFLKLQNRQSSSILNNFVSNALLNWVGFKNLDLNSAQNKINVIDSRFENLKNIQNVFLHCFYKKFHLIRPIFD